MDYPTIKQLVDKYWEGETSLKEEEQLRTYFNGPHVDQRLQSVQPLFVFFKQEQEKKSERPLRLLEVIRDRPQRMWGLVAASIAILMTATCWLCQQQYSLPNPSNLASQSTTVLERDTYEDPEVAFQEAKAALMRVSKELNKGVKVTKKGLLQTTE
ncbi:MAG: hypothetical protein ACRBFS_26885 [Aureispira sp.]